MGPDDVNAEKPEEKGWEADMSRKIELMHELFGAWMGRNVMELARGDRKKEESPIEGQMDLFDVSEE